MTWILIVSMMIGASAALTNIPGFADREDCIRAGQQVRALSKHEETVRYVCIAQIMEPLK